MPKLKHEGNLNKYQQVIDDKDSKDDGNTSKHDPEVVVHDVVGDKPREIFQDKSLNSDGGLLHQTLVNEVEMVIAGENLQDNHTTPSAGRRVHQINPILGFQSQVELVEDSEMESSYDESIHLDSPSLCLTQSHNSLLPLTMWFKVIELLLQIFPTLFQTLQFQQRGIRWGRIIN